MHRVMITVDEAWEIIQAHAPKLEPEQVPLRSTLGRVLAQPVIAGVTQPPLSVSAMDGYAVVHDDVSAGGANLTVVGEAPAGRPFGGAIRSGQAVRIFTGGAVPDGADHVVIQEHTVGDGDRVSVPEPEVGPRHIRRAGIDFEKGDELIPAGIEIGPAHISVAAAGNHAGLSVFRQPRVALITNGDELKPPGSNLKPGEIIASNGFGLAALIERWGGVAMDLGVAPDDPAAIHRMIERAVDADIILPVGGASVGDHDHMREVFRARGLEMVFEKVALKPGKPTWFGKLGGAMVLGLPGNPASAWVCAHVFLRPLMGRMLLRREAAKLAAPLPANGRRETLLRGRLEGGVVTPAPNQDSSLLTPFLSSNVVIRRRIDAPAVSEGETVDVLVLD